ncbi:MAG: DUF4336 domain-containing protein [Pseudooceanicola sp.]
MTGPDPLQPLGPGIWLADGPAIHAVAGFRYPTRMAVIRLGDGTLFAWSPVSLTAPLGAAIDRLGKVRHIVAPNGLHHLFLAEWQAAFPDATLHGTAALQAKRADLAFDATLTGTPDPAWAAEIDQRLVRTRITDEVVFFHRPSGTILFTDLLQHLPAGWFKGWRALVARLDRMTGPEPAIPRKFHLALRDRAELASVMEWNVKTVVMAHGAPVTENASDVLARALRPVL